MKHSCVIWSSIVAVILIITTATMFVWHAAVQPEPEISAAQHRVEEIYEGNAAAIQLLKPSTNSANIAFKTKVNPNDLKQFNSHLYNLAAERRWLLSTGKIPNTRQHIIIMRDKDLNVMHQMASKPKQWAKDEMTREFKHLPPVKENQLVIASLYVSTLHRSQALVITGGLLAIPTFLAVVIVIVIWYNTKANRKRDQLET